MWKCIYVSIYLVFLFFETKWFHESDVFPSFEVPFLKEADLKKSHISHVPENLALIHDSQIMDERPDLNRTEEIPVGRHNNI